MCLLEGFLLFGQLGNALILRGHLLRQVFHLHGNIVYWFHSQASTTICSMKMKKNTDLIFCACFSFSTFAKVSSRSSMSFFSSEHSSSSFLFLAVSSALISSSSSSLSLVSLSLASSWILLLMSPSHLSSASERFSDSCLLTWIYLTTYIHSCRIYI